MEGKRPRNEKIAAAVLFGFSLFYFFSGFSLKMGSPKNPGPGFIPGIIGILLVFFTGLHLARVLQIKPSVGKADSEEGADSGKNYRAILGTLACTILFPLVLETLKFLAATCLVTFMMLFFLKPEKPLFSFLLALGLTVGTFLIFSRLLGVALPMGPLESILFRIGG